MSPDGGISCAQQTGSDAAGGGMPEEDLHAYPELLPQPGSDIRKWINEWNKNPKPFVWIKSADDILETIVEYCQRITDS
jgi:hypothetical protein